MTDVAAFRAEFPVLERIAYLNAGTTGPVPGRAARASQEAVARAAAEGRTGKPYFEAKLAQADEIRQRMAGLFRCAPEHVALTGSTTDGVNVVLNGLDLPEGSEVLTSDEEHPGVLGPLAAAVRRSGWKVRIAPFDALAEAIGPETRLVACSHVSWVRGAVVDTDALRATGVPVLLDGAQGIGAVPLDMEALGCDWYAASGQKWLCGREGSGCLYVSARQLEETAVRWPSFLTFEDPEDPLAFGLKPGAVRFDLGLPADPAWTLAALDVFEEAGWDWVWERSRTLAARLAEALTARGLRVAERGEGPLVSWHDEDAEATVPRLAEERVLVRYLPGRGLVRASVGAWSTDEELDRLVQLVTRR